MNWIKTLWDKLVNSTSTSPTIVLVEEIKEDTTEELPPAGEILEQILLDAGIGQTTIDSLDILGLFEDWYNGPADVEEIKNSIQSFKEAMGGAINAKLNKVK